MTDDPNDAYEVAPIALGELMHSQGWWQCLRKGKLQWIGPEDRMRELANDPEARKEARRSKMHHDRRPA